MQPWVRGEYAPCRIVYAEKMEIVCSVGKSRAAVDALEAIKRLNEAGARLVSVEDNFDGSTPMGRFAIGILSLIAELELERIRESWGSAIRAAVAETGIPGRPRFAPISWSRC